MEPPASHNIGEQHTAYRRGLVLGLTMAEVGILIIFVLLLLIAFNEWRREGDARAMEGRVAIKADRLRTLEGTESLLTEIKKVLLVPENTSPDEIQRLIRALQEITVTREGQSTLKEIRAALEQIRDAKDQIKKEGGSDALVKELEKRSYQIANQEGQLQRYESQLKSAGLGKGERPCWVKADGTIEYLYDVVLASSGIRMREYQYPHRERERALLDMPAVHASEALSPAEFLRRTEALYNHSHAMNCRYFVVVYDGTGPTEKERYKQLLRTVEGHFYKRLDHGTPPF